MITDENVRHLAKLASLHLDDASITRMRGELEAIVGYVEQLSQVDTTGVEPLTNVSGVVNVTRADVTGPLIPTPQVLALAPARNEVAILVPKVVER
jgi:aspartyl-tRNA(Asn)/glutamyl-tRNA(Gln) amidotransferase subunit C